MILKTEVPNQAAGKVMGPGSTDRFGYCLIRGLRIWGVC